MFLAVTPVLPLFVALPAVKTNETELLDRVSEMESLRFAFNVMACAPELTT